MTELTAETVVDGAQPNDLGVAPDGNTVAFVVSPLGRSEEHARSAIWLAATDGSSTPRRLTAGTVEDRSPHWSPDGAWLYLPSDRAERGIPQLHRLPLAGGEAGAVTDWSQALPTSGHCRVARSSRCWPLTRRPRRRNGGSGERTGSGDSLPAAFHPDAEPFPREAIEALVVDPPAFAVEQNVQPPGAGANLHRRNIAQVALQRSLIPRLTAGSAARPAADPNETHHHVCLGRLHPCVRSASRRRCVSRLRSATSIPPSAWSKAYTICSSENVSLVTLRPPRDGSF